MQARTYALVPSRLLRVSVGRFCVLDSRRFMYISARGLVWQLIQQGTLDLLAFRETRIVLAVVLHPFQIAHPFIAHLHHCCDEYYRICWCLCHSFTTAVLSCVSFLWLYVRDGFMMIDEWRMLHRYCIVLCCCFLCVYRWWCRLGSHPDACPPNACTDIQVSLNDT